MTVYYGWYIEQMDVVTAFLYKKIDGVIYVKMPHKFSIPSIVYRLNKALYGLKQSPRIWQETLNTTFKALSFRRLYNDYALYINNSTDTFVGIYVDDLLIFGADLAFIKELKASLAQQYRITDLGSYKDYLGTEIHRDIIKQTLTIN